jgi:hypothetical protein
MKYYTIESIPHTFGNEIKIFNENGAEEFCATIPVHLVNGYSCFLEDLGYKYKQED